MKFPLKKELASLLIITVGGKYDKQWCQEDCNGLPHENLIKELRKQPHKVGEIFLASFLGFLQLIFIDMLTSGTQSIKTVPFNTQ